jgi:hypothetical protein
MIVKIARSCRFTKAGEPLTQGSRGRCALANGGLQRIDCGFLDLQKRRVFSGTNDTSDNGQEIRRG